MKRVLMIAVALSTLAVTMSDARAEGDSAYKLVSCRRYVPQPPASSVPPKALPPTQSKYLPNDSTVDRQSASAPTMPASFSRTPAQRTPSAPSSPDLTAGRTYTVKVRYLGEKSGDVVLYIGSTSHACSIRSWAPNEVVFEVPNMGVPVSGASAELRITRPDGVVGLNRAVRVINPPDVLEHEDPAPVESAVQQETSPDFRGAAFYPLGNN